MVFGLMIVLALLYVSYIKEIAKTNWLVDVVYAVMGESVWICILYWVYQDAQIRKKRLRNE
jgi:hypothetical protein